MPVRTLRLLALLSATLFATITRAQWVSIPDTNFGRWLNSSGFSQCLQGNSTIGWQMDTMCSYVRSAKIFTAHAQQIEDLTGIQYFDSLQQFGCNNNNLSALPPLPPMLKHLSLDGQYSSNPALAISSLPDLPGTLITLSCRSNNLTTLPALPTGLQSIDCRDNAITFLPALPATLTYLNVDVNLLSTLPALPAGLPYISCNDNPITVLPALPVSLTQLSCSRCSLALLPALPLGLRTLYCNQNSLSSLPALPDSLREFTCPYNLLTTLPALPDQLQVLTCSYNLLTALPTLPAKLQMLSCVNNSITQLPVLPESFYELWCNNNPLTALPTLPASLKRLYAGGCNLTFLPELPDSLNHLIISKNPISCLPQLKKLVIFEFDSTNITCLPNYPLNNIASYPLITGYPLCQPFNNQGCSVYWNISGEQYVDVNADCTMNQNEQYAEGVTVQLWNNGNLVKQNINTGHGFYSFDTDNFSTYQITIDTSNIPFRILCPSTGSLTSVISAADSMDYNMDFALECKPGFDLEARSVSTTQGFRPANFTTVDVSAGDASNFYNAHCAAGTAGNIILSYTGPLKYVSTANGALTPTSVSNNTLTWSITDFGNVNFFEDFDVIMQTDTFAQIGQQVCFTLTVSPIINDNNPANNTFTICFPVVNSYDPNDKQTYPAGNIDTLQRDLIYTVRFQNTGNAEAQHIYITDTLDANVRPETFELLAYSHQPMVQIDGRAVRFNFPNINLPDSFSNEPQSHGYVQYRVKLRENLPVGTVINNTAFIYFDFNTPVITNTTTNTVSVEVDTTVGIRNIKPTAEVFVYPNPANKGVTITVSESMSNATVTVNDLLGRKAVEPVWLNNMRSISLNTQHLSEGVYIVNVTSKAGTTLTRRLVINH
jgi:hypothetical protein